MSRLNVCRSGALRSPCYLSGPMRLIVTEKNNSAKKIADIRQRGTAEEDASFRTPLLHLGGDDGPQMTIGLKGHVLNPAFPEDYKSWQKIDPRDLIDAELIKRADRQERRQGDQEGRQGRRRPRHRDGLRPRGRADRPRGAAGDRRVQPQARHRRRRARGRHPGQARPLLRPDQGGDRAGLQRPRTSSRCRSPTPAPHARTST